MNDKQREYLIKSVNNTFNAEVEQIKAKIRKKPSLNNYITAAFLDNSIEFKDLNSLKDKIRNRVIRAGTDNAIIETIEKRNTWGGYNTTETVKVDASDLFVLPEAYVKEFELWEKETADINNNIEALRGQLKTIEIKITLGSNTQLDKLITEADNLGAISLISSRLQLALNQ